VTYFRGGLQPLYLRAASSVQRAIKVECPICHALPGNPCKYDEQMPVVHDARESIAYHGKKIWT